MLNYLWASTVIRLIFTMETNTIQYMHAHWGSNCHDIQHCGEKKLSATRPIYSAANWTVSQPSVLYITPYFTHSPPLFPLFSPWISSVMMPDELPFISRGQGLAVLSRSGSHSSGDREKKALQGSLHKDAVEPAPHACIHRHYHYQRVQRQQ